MQIDNPDVLDELMACHVEYEKALMENDVATLDALFWDSSLAVRYGVSENLHGAAEIHAFRAARPTAGLQRTISWFKITAFDEASGVINLEFVRVLEGVERQGRQTQFWVRFAQGWKIVSAHVSLLPGPQTYVDAAASRIGVPVHSGDRVAVIEDLSRIGTIAQFLMEFPLPQEVEAAPVFQP